MVFINRKEKLLSRLEQIGESLKLSGKARALVGFGSAAEVDRMDAYSDLDFLAVAKKGQKSGLIQNIDWLTSIAPVGYYYQFISDGYKLIFEDGVFCDFGIVEESDLNQFPHADGRIVWCEEDFDPSLCLSTHQSNYEVTDINKALGDALTSLYVGLCRFIRGEKLSAARLIQKEAIDHVLACSHLLNKETSYFKDPFQNERRYERRYPSLAVSLPNMIQGYEKSPESALAILKFMEDHFEVNPFMKQTIYKLCNSLIDK